MRIDEQIEETVRAVIEAVVKRDPNQLDRALAAFPDGATRTRGMELAIAISGYIVFEEYNGAPTSGETRLLAEEIARLCEWAGISADDTTTYLRAVLDQQPLESVFDADTAVMLTFIVTGCLVASSEKIGKNEWWFDYLDRVEAAIEAAPEF